MKIGDQVIGVSIKGEKVAGIVSAIRDNTAVIVLPSKERVLITLDEKVKKDIAKNRKENKKGEPDLLLLTKRKEKGLTQKQVAEFIGTTQGAVCMFEQGKNNPSDEILEKYAALLEVSVLELKEQRTKDKSNQRYPKLAYEPVNQTAKKSIPKTTVPKTTEPMFYPKSEKEVLAMKTEIKSTPDMVNRPPHYQIGGMETIEVLELVLSPEEYRGYLKGNIIKYRERAKHKGNEQQDYEKALWYKERLEGLK